METLDLTNLMMTLGNAESYSISEDNLSQGALILGDNLKVLSKLKPYLTSRVRFIYLDPPFYTNSRFKVKFKLPHSIAELLGLKRLTFSERFSDKWEGSTEEEKLNSYLEFLKPRLKLFWELLRDDGFLAIHLDFRAVHYVKVLADQIFGMRNFRNQVIWYYGGRGAKYIASQLPRNHDVILIYSKQPDAEINKLWQELKIPTSEARRMGYRKDSDGRWYKTAPRGDYTDKSLEELAKEGRVLITSKGNIRVKYYLEERDGYVIDRRLLGDVWTDIPDMMHTPTSERLGYPTQKPEALLRRLIALFSSEGDLVLDPFCGAGTTAVVASGMKRSWICVDVSRVAISLARFRILNRGINFLFHAEDREELLKMSLEVSTKLGAEDKFELKSYKPNLEVIDPSQRKVIEDIMRKLPPSDLEKLMLTVSVRSLSESGGEYLKVLDIFGGECDLRVPESVLSG